MILARLFKRENLFRKGLRINLRQYSRTLRAKAARKGYSFQQHFDDMLEKYPKMKSRFTRPIGDNLYEANHVHEGSKDDCLSCSMERLITRPPRIDEEALVFYGRIGPVNKVDCDDVIRFQSGRSECL